MTFYTPTYQRPSYLAICRQSVQAQTCRDFQHMVIVDDVGIGCGGMFRDIRKHIGRIRGEYVFILADDDRLFGRISLEKVKAFATENNLPAVIIVRNWKWGGVFPTLWEQEPQLGAIDTGNFIIQADIFKANADHFGERYEGDFDFIHYLWEIGIPFTWYDFLFSEMQVGGKGRTEAEIMEDQKARKVRALTSFVSSMGEISWAVQEGDELEMPAGLDWILSGLAEPIETAMIGPAEKAIGRGGKRKK